jgi:hypothetical protein
LVGIILLIINLWTNANFIEHQKPGTTILQLALLKPIAYCKYKYIFYKLDLNNEINYMCPNNYIFFIPSTGILDSAPDFLIQHFFWPQKL